MIQLGALFLITYWAYQCCLHLSLNPIWWLMNLHVTGINATCFSYTGAEIPTTAGKIHGILTAGANSNTSSHAATRPRPMATLPDKSQVENGTTDQDTSTKQPQEASAIPVGESILTWSHEADTMIIGTALVHELDPKLHYLSVKVICFAYSVTDISLFRKKC